MDTAREGGFKPAPVDVYASLKGAQRQRLCSWSICYAFFTPWLLFCFTFATMSFDIHYRRPALAYSIVGGLALLVFLTASAAAAALRAKTSGDPDRKPSWLVFISASMLVGLVLGIIFGALNLRHNTKAHMDLSNMNAYHGVDPSIMRGQQLMDAGTAFFADGVRLDLRKSMGFTNLDTYCVAPITQSDVAGPVQLATYDFWAVGLGCCSGNAADFQCGDYNHPRASAGLRMMENEQRDFFRLAVQQAEAEYNIKATHPLFFYWMRPEHIETEMEAYRTAAQSSFFIGMLAHFLFQLFCVCLAIRGFSNMGHA